DGVGNRVRVVVGGIDAPGIARTVMRGMADAVERRVAHVDVWRRYVDSRPQDVYAIRKLARLHLSHERQVLFGRPVTVGAFAPGLGQRPAIFAGLVGRQAVHVREAVD